MDDDHDAIRVAIGLMRAARTYLERAGDHPAIAQLETAIALARDGQAEPLPDELAPEAACLIAAIPLGDFRASDGARPRRTDDRHRPRMSGRAAHP